jgi:hypothetical protein
VFVPENVEKTTLFGCPEQKEHLVVDGRIWIVAD